MGARVTDDARLAGDRDVFYGLAIAAESLAKLLVAGEVVGEAGGIILLEHVHAARRVLGLAGERPRQAPDRDALEHAVAQELDDAAAVGLTVRDVVDRLWADFADHYAHRASLRKAAYEVLAGFVEAGTAHGEGIGKRGQGARYYASEHYDARRGDGVREGQPHAASH